MEFSREKNRKSKPAKSISITVPRGISQILLKWEFEFSVQETHRKEEKKLNLNLRMYTDKKVLSLRLKRRERINEKV